MTKIVVELVKYDMDKTKKRKRKNFFVDTKTEDAVVDKLEKIHKGEKVQAIHEIVWGEETKDPKEKSEIYSGLVKFYDEVKGFGFIQPDLDMDDLFFHASALDSVDVTDQDLVQFEVGSGSKGKIAIHVKLID
jgi:CspA family cold shock protein